MKKIPLIVSVVMLFTYACSQTSNRDGSPTVATVDGTSITAEDVRDELTMLPEEVMGIFEDQGGIEALINEMAKREMLHKEALKKGYAKNPDFKNRLEVLKKRLMVEMLLEKEIENTATVSDEEVRDFYEQNKKRFEAEVPGKEGTTVMDFEVVEDAIRQRLTAQRQREAFGTYMQSLQSKYQVEIDEQAVAEAFPTSGTPEEGKGPEKALPEGTRPATRQETGTQQ